MKLFVVLLVTVGLLPLVGVGGYLLNPDPSLRASITQHLKADNEAEEKYLFVVTAGRFKGDQNDALYALQYTDAQLRKLLGAKGKFIWQRAECRQWSTSGNIEALEDPEILTYCTTRRATRKEVEKWAKTQLPPRASGRYAPAA